MSSKKSPEESGEGKRPARGDSDKWDGGGFGDGEHGRGSTPYKRSHSREPASLESQNATSGRGGAGIIGKADDFKGDAEDLEHPQTHSEFEGLGAGDSG